MSSGTWQNNPQAERSFVRTQRYLHMNETGRVRSIARKIGNSWAMRTAWLMVVLDVLIILLVVIAGLYGWEQAILGDAWSPDIQRIILRGEGPGAVNVIIGMRYQVRSPSGTPHSLHLGNLIEMYLPFLAILGVAELIILIGQCSGAHRKARRILAPLDKMARDMKLFSRTQSRANGYEERLHDLENAIGEISPNHPEAKLRTGAEELYGLENAINALLVRMHESYRQQAQFVSDASHELRTPIAVIQGYANMLARWGKDDEKVLEESIAAIQSESDYMKKLVEELLFLARGEIGRNPFSPADMSLTGLIRDVCEESAMIDVAHQWAFDPETPEITLYADAGMLKQCARILCENARKYTPAGGTIRLRVFTNGDGAPCFQVQDEGIGIAEADAPRIFDRFYRSDPARDRNSGGTGLGLAIAKWIVDRHNGYFELLSREGIGTRITVTLPRTVSGDNC